MTHLSQSRHPAPVEPLRSLATLTFTAREAARSLGIGRPMIYRLTRVGRLHPERLRNGNFRFRPEDLQAYEDVKLTPGYWRGCYSELWANTYAAAEALGVTHETARRWAEEGRFPGAWQRGAFTRGGFLWLIPWAEVWAARIEVPMTDADRVEEPVEEPLGDGIEELLRCPTLTDRGREIMRLRYAEGLTAGATRAKMGVSRQYVWQEERLAIRRIRQWLYSTGLDERPFRPRDQGRSRQPGAVGDEPV